MTDGELKPVWVYCDGSFMGVHGTIGPGGWGAVWVENGGVPTEEACEAIVSTGSLQCEIQAIHGAVKWARDSHGTHYHLHLMVDIQDLADIVGRWERGALVVNPLYQQIFSGCLVFSRWRGDQERVRRSYEMFKKEWSGIHALVSTFARVSAVRIKGHGRSKYHNRCHQLAREAAARARDSQQGG